MTKENSALFVDTDLYIGDVPPHGMSKLNSSNTMNISESKRSVRLAHDSANKHAVFKRRNNSI